MYVAPPTLSAALFFPVHTDVLHVTTCNYRGNNTPSPPLTTEVQQTLSTIQNRSSSSSFKTDFIHKPQTLSPKTAPNRVQAPVSQTPHTLHRFSISTSAHSRHRTFSGGHATSLRFWVSTSRSRRHEYRYRQVPNAPRCIYRLSMPPKESMLTPDREGGERGGGGGRGRG